MNVLDMFLLDSRDLFLSGRRREPSLYGLTAQRDGVRTGNHLATFKASPNRQSFELSPDGSRLVSAFPNKLQLWDGKTGHHIPTHRKDFGLGYRIRFLPDGSKFSLGLISKTELLDSAMV